MLTRGPGAQRFFAPSRHDPALGFPAARRCTTCPTAWTTSTCSSSGWPRWWASRASALNLFYLGGFFLVGACMYLVLRWVGARRAVAGVVAGALRAGAVPPDAKHRPRPAVGLLQRAGGRAVGPPRPLGRPTAVPVAALAPRDLPTRRRSRGGVRGARLGGGLLRGLRPAPDRPGGPGGRRGSAVLASRELGSPADLHRRRGLRGEHLAEHRLLVAGGIEPAPPRFAAPRRRRSTDCASPSSSCPVPVTGSTSSPGSPPAASAAPSTASWARTSAWWLPPGSSCSSGWPAGGWWRRTPGSAWWATGRGRSILDAAFLTLGCLLTAAAGGFSYLLSALGMREIRAWNRMSIVIAALACVGVALVVSQLLDHLEARGRAAWGAAAARAPPRRRGARPDQPCRQPRAARPPRRRGSRSVNFYRTVEDSSAPGAPCSSCRSWSSPRSRHSSGRGPTTTPLRMSTPHRCAGASEG